MPVLLEALLRYARSETGESFTLPVAAPAPARDHAGTVGYCTSFVIHQVMVSPDAIRRVFAMLGDSPVLQGIRRW